MENVKHEMIKKGKNVVIVTIGIISFILTFIIFMQFKFVQNTDLTSIKNMRQEELKEELIKWKEKNAEIDEQLQDIKNKLAEYEDNIENSEETSKLIEAELYQNNLLLGQTDVYGEGVVIYYEDNSTKVMASDLLRLINELYMAEAEAISINEKRLVNSSEIVETGESMYVNGERVSSPYIIKVIGNKKLLEGSMTGINRFAESEPKAGKKFTIEARNTVTIPKYNGIQKVENINLK